MVIKIHSILMSFLFKLVSTTKFKSIIYFSCNYFFLAFVSLHLTILTFILRTCQACEKTNTYGCNLIWNQPYSQFWLFYAVLRYNLINVREKMSEWTLFIIIVFLMWHKQTSINIISKSAINYRLYLQLQILSYEIKLI